MDLDLKHTYITSDHHFGSWKGLSCFQVFSKDKEDDIIRKWNEQIKHNHIVIYLGDFCDGNLADVIEYKKRLNGEIILVKGNHDSLPDNVYKAIFKDVVNELKLNDITLKHCPNLESNERQIFGHMHRDGINDPYFLKNGFCVCASMNDGRLISLEEILKIQFKH